ncbi:Glyoxalase/Bleomycin resistance protein/Dihydroxybiphenyl dioxygenase [Plenodomus tracheiphilus IPT5]|uniref:Glyoxalase/Bleomycin resistance protein/Dihydroxybiphenyl dioxygenase n=1 Tax=Plenodomus tracheiphilus IPT5 TaxID=1408161 RepID=A0A6A7AU45_9PLEO|nr:Glyoxalase/Bleomycin resistance protein/Dihydroxybiphenyl dioxygenase [Plenodomus tracheiphilus IPT5]
MNVDFDAPADTVKCPSKLAHVVLRTSNLRRLVEYYRNFLGAQVIYENQILAFLSYDDEHHRIAIIEAPGTQAKVPTSCGLEHIAFSFNSLPDLLLAYRQRKHLGILPLWCVNHGPTTSIYYRDPDGNEIETQVDNFTDADGATEFMRSKAFAENPIGVDFDPEEFIKRLSQGETEEVLKKRVDIGPRGLPDHML